MADLRSHLQAVIAGKVPSLRGHSITPADVATAAPMAKACNALFISHYGSYYEEDEPDRSPLPPPSELLTPLP